MSDSGDVASAFDHHHHHHHPTLLDDLCPVFKRLRKEQPVARGQAYGDLWVVPRYDPPNSLKYRQLVNRAFAPTSIEALVPSTGIS